MDGSQFGVVRTAAEEFRRNVRPVEIPAKVKRVEKPVKNSLKSALRKAGL